MIDANIAKKFYSIIPQNQYDPFSSYIVSTNDHLEVLLVIWHQLDLEDDLPWTTIIFQIMTITQYHIPS